jgi:hypothetical protein
MANPLAWEPNRSCVAVLNSAGPVLIEHLVRWVQTEPVDCSESALHMKMIIYSFLCHGMACESRIRKFQNSTL